ncbi:hypothetical protein [Nonomuraea sp. JJY05]|uniref:hypothetical protein n=1 Tax=Nonomuraea sp. JJY05 TaxID=3350255 RepID=UPI00373FB927
MWSGLNARPLTVHRLMPCRSAPPRCWAGHLSVSSWPGTGFRVEASLPLEAPR